ncbi:MAG: hypothetical protein M5U26_24465 [Planctomycetota bacterium]|nr:hypothetical protein [Planctomycetota bacterium]
MDLQGASFALGAPLLANGRTTTWQLKNGTTYVRVTLSNATGRFSIAARNVDLDAGLAAAGADNLATYFNAPVELNLSLRIGTWGSRARLRTLYTLRTVGTTGTGRFRYGAPGFELPEGLLIATRMRIMQRSDKLGGFQQRAMADLALRLPQGQEPDPTAGGAALALADFTENVGDGSIPNLVFTGTGTSFSYRRGSKDGLGQPIPLTGVSSMSFNNRTWTVRALTHWLDDGVLGVAPVTDPLNDPAFVDVPVALTVNGVTLETLVRLTRLGRSSLYRR